MPAFAKCFGAISRQWSSRQHYSKTKESRHIAGESMRKAIEQYPYPHGEGQPLGKVSISGGVSTYPEDGTGPSALIEVADACLYKSKEHGRNHVTRMASRDVLA